MILFSQMLELQSYRALFMRPVAQSFEIWCFFESLEIQDDNLIPYINSIVSGSFRDLCFLRAHKALMNSLHNTSAYCGQVMSNRRVEAELMYFMLALPSCCNI